MRRKIRTVRVKAGLDVTGVAFRRAEPALEASVFGPSRIRFEGTLIISGLPELESIGAREDGAGSPEKEVFTKEPAARLTLSDAEGRPIFTALLYEEEFPLVISGKMMKAKLG